MIELKVYRHKVHKELYLTRTNAVGGNEKTMFYETTPNILDAIRSLEKHGDSFMSWYRSFPNNKTKAVFAKEMEFDGYKGILTKAVDLPICEFELVTLKETNIE